MSAVPHPMPAAVVVSLVAGDDDPRAWCRRLAAEVNHGSMHLARVIATGTQVYPVRNDTWSGTATVLRCEFRMRNTGTPATAEAAHALLARLQHHQMLEAYFVDAYGTALGPVDALRAAS